MTEIRWESLKPEKVVRNNLGECVMYYVSLRELGDFLVFHFKGKVDYIKVTRPFPGKWDCTHALYNPFGLFAFDLGKKPLFELIREKMEEMSRAKGL